MLIILLVQKRITFLTQNQTLQLLHVLSLFRLQWKKKAGKVLYFHTETTCVTGSLHLKLYRFLVATIFYYVAASIFALANFYGLIQRAYASLGMLAPVSANSNHIAHMPICGHLVLCFFFSVDCFNQLIDLIL